MRILILLLIVASEIRANDCVGLFDKKTSALENIFLEKNQELLSESVPHYYKARDIWFENTDSGKQYKKEKYPPESKEWVEENGLIDLTLWRNELADYKKGQNPFEFVRSYNSVEVPLILDGKLLSWIGVSKSNGSWENHWKFSKSPMHDRIYESIQADKLRDLNPKKYFLLSLPGQHLLVLKETPQQTVVWYVGSEVLAPYPGMKSEQHIPFVEFIEKMADYEKHSQ